MIVDAEKTVKRCFAALGYKVIDKHGFIAVFNGFCKFKYPRYVAVITNNRYYAYLNCVGSYNELATILMRYPMFGYAESSGYLRWESLAPIDWIDNMFYGKSIDEVKVMLDLIGY